MVCEQDALCGPGTQGFSKQYWDHNYSAPKTMDGIFNAREQAAYTYHMLRSEFVEIGSIVDLGFGLGHLFEAMMAAFVPHTAVGIEPSAHAFHTVKRRSISPVSSTELSLYQTDLLTWCTTEEGQKPFDLGICSSVFQYLTDPEMHAILPLLARRVRYLYFSVPTDVELAYQKKHLGLDDTYAFSRTKEVYREALRPHFTIISKRIVESKVHFDFRNTAFDDDLFRF